MAELHGHRDLKVYQLPYRLAIEIFQESKVFPGEERYSLTDQIRRSSRSVAANIAEGFRKRRYPNMFISKLADADGEATETQVWLDFARDCGYLPQDRHTELTASYEEVGRMLGAMMRMPDQFRTPQQRPSSPLPTAYCLLPTGPSGDATHGGNGGAVPGPGPGARRCGAHPYCLPSLRS